MVRMGPSGFAFEDLMRGSFEDFSAQVFSEMIDLNLGNWACLENFQKRPSSVFSTPSTTATEKLKPDSPIPLCQVEGCNLDLSEAKDYHRKNRVCDSHSKSPKVIVKGLERRFCQQCSRFHGLSEFDEKKRSCRKRLSARNARRRKKQLERIGFNSSWLPASSFCGQQQVSGNQVYNPISMDGNSSNGFLAPYGTATSGVLTAQGLKDENSATDYVCALSLLSSNSWGSCEPVSIPFDNIGWMVHAVPPSSEYWLPDGQLPSTYPRGIGTDFYFSPLHHY